MGIVRLDGCTEYRWPLPFYLGSSFRSRISLRACLGIHQINEKRYESLRFPTTERKESYRCPTRNERNISRTSPTNNGRLFENCCRSLRAEALPRRSAVASYLTRSSMLYAVAAPGGFCPTNFPTGKQFTGFSVAGA